MKIKIFHANAGYGHRKVAEIVHNEFLKRQFGPKDVVVEDALDSTPWSFRNFYPAIYFNSVKHTPVLWGWSYETLDKAPWSQWITPIRVWGNQIMGERLVKRMQEEAPEVIICTHFFSAELFSRAAREGKIKSRIVTIITDFYPHSFWVNPGTDLYWVMSDEGAEELYRRGVERSRVVAGGIPVGEEFLPQGKKNELLPKWDFQKDRFTLLVTSGSFGLGPTAEILRRLKDFAEKIQVFVVCGNNRALEDELKSQAFSFPVKIFGFVNFMPELMEASDLLIAKPGGSTTSESLAKGLPMVVLNPIPGQEARNADALKQRNAAFFLGRPEDIKTIMQTIFSYPDVLNEKKRAVQELAKPYAARDLADYVLNHFA